MNAEMSDGVVALAFSAGGCVSQSSVVFTPTRPKRITQPKRAKRNRTCASSSSFSPTLKYQIYGMHKEATLDKKTTFEEDNILSKNWKIKMLYDGECPLCMREVNMLKERNKPYGAIKFIDISSSEYSPEENQGLDYETVMGRIHAIMSDGKVVRDVEAFRRLYEEVGLGWVYAITKYEPIATVANAIYDVWAKYRLQITGRPPLEDVLKARRETMGEVCGDKKACKM